MMKEFVGTAGGAEGGAGEVGKIRGCECTKIRVQRRGLGRGRAVGPAGATEAWGAEGGARRAWDILPPTAPTRAYPGGLAPRHLAS